MPLFDKFSREARSRKYEEKIQRKKDELIKNDQQLKKQAEYQSRLAVYDQQRRERELAEENMRLERQLQERRQRDEEKEEEKRQKDILYQAALAKKRAEELEEEKRIHLEEIRRLEADHFSRNHEAQLRLAEERKKSEEVTQQLRKEREDRDKAIRAEADRQQRLKQKKDAERRKMEEEDMKLLQAEKQRQRDQLVNHNDSRALQELRDLIRERYELDMEIYRMRTYTEANRDLVEKRMVKSDEVLQKIRSIVEVWSPATFDESGIEWVVAEQVKERLLADGKRIWATDPPWPIETREGGAPPRGGRRARGRRGGRMSSASPDEA